MPATVAIVPTGAEVDHATPWPHEPEYVRAGVFKGLSNATLHELGAELT